MSPRDFWRRLDEHTGPGVLVLVLLASWKRVADGQGMDATDLLSTVFESVCHVAGSTALMQSRITATVYAAYWRDQDSGSSAVKWLERWLPMNLATPRLVIPLETRPVSVLREQDETGRSCYGSAQRSLASVIEDLPEGERYPGLTITWEEAVGR